MSTRSPFKTACRFAVPNLLALLAPGAAAAGSPVGAGQAVQVVAGLGIVLALIALAAWGTRRLQGYRGQSAGRIRIVEALPVGARERLLLVEVDDRRVLIGMCPGRIATLHAFPASAAATTPATFGEALAVAAQPPRAAGA